jgi:hypothetical protein
LQGKTSLALYHAFNFFETTHFLNHGAGGPGITLQELPYCYMQQLLSTLADRNIHIGDVLCGTVT